MKQTAGISRVARAAGVSVTTVSNVLNGRSERMSADTRRRVMQAIEQLGYTPSASARQLKTGRSRTIGLVVPTVANPFWGAVVHEIEKSALARGYNVMICNAERDPAAERRYAETLLSYGVKGVIFGSSPVSFDHLSSLRSRGLVIAAFDRLGPGADAAAACSVGVDNELGVRLAIQHLIGLGHRRIGAISGPVRTESRIKRLAGFRAAMSDAGLAIHEDLIWTGDAVSGYGDSEGAELGRAGMRELLTRRDRPTAVFAMNDYYAWGAYAGASDMGFRIPDDLSIVGFDDILLSQLIQPPLTTVRQPTAAMARNIVSSLLAQLESEPDDDAQNHTAAAPALVIRNSTAPPPAGAGARKASRGTTGAKRKP